MNDFLLVLEPSIEKTYNLKYNKLCGNPTCIAILDLRELILLRSLVNKAIEELQNDLEEEPFNPSW